MAPKLPVEIGSRKTEEARCGPRNGRSGASEPWLTYLRYDPELERAWLKDRLGLDLRDDQVEGLRKMDDPTNLDALARLGEATAALVKEAHFAARFAI